MLKMVKVKKNLRLDELIKYVWDNHLYPETFKSNFNDFAHFDKTGKYKLIEQRALNQATKFTVEVEEPITEDTEFYSLLGIYTRDGVLDSFGMNYCSIKDIKNYPLDVTHVLKEIIYLDDFNHVQTVWERDSDEQRTKM